MSSSSRAWAVAATIGAVEGLKDLGFCRWNYTLRSVHQYAKNNIGSFSQAQKLSSSFGIVRSDEGRAKESEESLRKVMFLSCWGPN